MGVLNIYHPDIEEFIDAKSHDANTLNHFNLSVMVDDEFMRAVQENRDITLHWPVYDKNGKIEKNEIKWMVTQEANARELWDKIMTNAYNNGEPGIFFYDNLNKDNPLSYCETVVATNPCSEYTSGVIFGKGYESKNYGGACNLGSLVLHSFVKNPFTKEAELDVDSLSETIKIAVRFLDNIIDVNHFPDKIYENYQKRFRTIGLGMTSLADTLVMLNIKYDSEEAYNFVEDLTNFISFNAYKASIDLAKEKGHFPGYEEEYLNNGFLTRHLWGGKFYREWEEIHSKIEEHGIRNGKILSIAPVGSLSLAFGNNCSSGIEPIFSLEYDRKIKIGGQQEENEKIIQIQDYAYALYNKLKNEGKDIIDNPPFVTALEIPVEGHIKMLGVIARNIDMSVSKTINVPTEYPFDKCKDIYMQCWKEGIKGCTIFRPNEIRQGILLSNSNKSKDEEVQNDSNLPRGYVIKSTDNLFGVKRKLTTGCGTMHLLVYYDPDTKHILEVYAGKGSSGGCEKNLVAMTRLISLSLRGGVPFEEVIDQLESCGGCSAFISRRVSKHDTSPGSSCATAIAKALIEIYNEINNTEFKISKKQKEENSTIEVSAIAKCPECGEPLSFEGGCNICKSCGWSKCQ